MTRPAELIYSLVLKEARPSGMLDTLEARLESMQSILPGAHGLCFFRGDAPESGRYKRITFVRVHAKSREISHLLFPLYLWRWLKVSGAQPRHVVVRYHFPSPLFGLLFRKRKFTLVSEHHTDLEANLSTLPGFAGKVLPLVSRALRPTTDCVIDGKIGLTREILRKESVDTSMLIVGNGVDPGHRSNDSYRAFDGQTLNVVTVISADWEWNGLERMILSMETWADLNSDILFRLTVVGPSPKISIDSDTKITLELLGPKQPREISDLVGNFDFAFSSLGAWRMGLNEGCPLKSRMYIGLGLPYLAAYVDPDVDDSRRFVMRCANSATPIEWPGVFQFLERLRSSRADILEDFVEARQELAHEKKSAQIISFLEDLTGS